MKTFINNCEIDITEHHDEHIFGLSFKPKMTSFDNDADWAVFTKHGVSKEVSKRSFDLVDQISKNYMTHGVMEIGVSRNGPDSFTQALLKNKPSNIPYLGVDVEDKTYLNNSEKKIFTIQESSFNQTRIREYMHSVGIQKLSILFIDGWHSVNACINDWRYADLLSDDGIVIFHDTNFHPGPSILIESIDKAKFCVTKYFENEDDYGVSIAHRIS